MQPASGGVNVKKVSDNDDLLQLQLTEQALRPDADSEHDPMTPLLGERGYNRAAVLSLANTVYVSSAGLALLLVWHKCFREAGGKLVFHSITASVMEMLRILHMELVLNLAQDVNSALAAARGEAT